MPRYSATASVCDRATWADTSVTTACFSLRLRLKVHSPSTHARAAYRLRALRFSDLPNWIFRFLFGGTPSALAIKQLRGAAPAVFDDPGHPVSRVPRPTISQGRRAGDPVTPIRPLARPGR